jgi:hypothetical protein
MTTFKTALLAFTVACGVTVSAVNAQPYVQPAPGESFLHANPNALHDMLGHLMNGTYPGQTDDMRSLDAACKDMGEAQQREWNMFNQCQENHRQLVEKGLAAAPPHPAPPAKVDYPWRKFDNDPTACLAKLDAFNAQSSQPQYQKRLAPDLPRGVSLRAMMADDYYHWLKHDDVEPSFDWATIVKTPCGQAILQQWGLHITPQEQVKLDAAYAAARRSQR